MKNQTATNIYIGPNNNGRFPTEESLEESKFTNKMLKSSLKQFDKTLFKDSYKKP